MANIINYGLIGVGGNVQLGKNGPKLLGNTDTDAFSVTGVGGALTTISGATKKNNTRPQNIL